MKNPKKVVSKIGGVVLGLSIVAFVCPQTAQAQFIQRSFLNPSFEQNLTPSTANPTSPGATTIPISTRTNCFIQVDQTSVPGWSTTHTPINGSGNCPSFVGPGLANLIELWTTTFQGVIAPNGTVFAELNAEQNSQLFQNLCLFNNETIQFSVTHRGRASATVADVASFAVNNQRAVQFATASDGNPNSITTPFAPTNVTNIVTNAPAVVGASAPGWVRHSGSLRYTGTSGNIPVGFEAISTGGGNITIGNFIDDTQFAGLPVIEFSVSSGGAAEAEINPTSNPPKIRVVGLVPAGGIVVPISIGAGSTAVLGVDFNTPTGTNNFTVTIPAGNYDGSNATSTFFIPFTIIQDGTTEGNETIVFEIGSSSNYFISSTTACGSPPIGNSTYTVFDDEFLSGNVFNDVDNSANGTFTNIQTGSEVGTNAGGLLNAILVSSSGNVLATTPVNANGTYIFTDVPFNQNNVTIRLSTSVGTVGAAAPAASLPLGWIATSPLETAPFNTGTNITGKDFGIAVPIVSAYKSVALTTDVDSSGTITSNDRLTWRVSYANTGTVDVPNFQISDVLPTNVTLFGTLAAGNITVNPTQAGTITPTANASYTGAGNNNLFASSFTLKAGGVVTVNIPGTINPALPNGTILSNQPTGSSPNFPPAGVRTDNIDSTTAGLPTGVTPIASSITQTQNPSIDPTTVTVVGGTPNLLLVKRITAINGTSITGFVDGADTATSNDNDPNWPGSPNSPQYLRGAIDCTTALPCNGGTISSVAPGGLIEYTIYFLSNGTRPASNVQLCDRIPTDTIFQPDTYGSGNGILLGWDGTVLPDPSNSTIGAGKVALNNVPDTDAGQFLAANVSVTNAPAPCNDGATNPDGAILVRLGAAINVPRATASGVPTDSYGFVRFVVRVR